MRKKEPLNWDLLLFMITLKIRFQKKQQAIKEEQKELEAAKAKDEPKANKNSRSCC